MLHDDGDVKDCTLPRTGDAPLAFRGRLLAAEDGDRQAGGREPTRWHALALYQTVGGRYVLAVSYYSRWQGELEHHDAWACPTPEEVVQHLRGYQATRWVRGYPEGEAYTRKQELLLDDVHARYCGLAAALLGVAPEFAERVE